MKFTLGAERHSWTVYDRRATSSQEAAELAGISHRRVYEVGGRAGKGQHLPARDAWSIGSIAPGGDVCRAFPKRLGATHLRAVLQARNDCDALGSGAPETLSKSAPRSVAGRKTGDITVRVRLVDFARSRRSHRGRRDAAVPGEAGDIGLSAADRVGKIGVRHVNHIVRAGGRDERRHGVSEFGKPAYHGEPTGG
jgi:hypothetical protein